MAGSYWRDKAARVIGRTVLQWCGERGLSSLQSDLQALPEPDRKALLQAVRAAYPFGPRAGWPYQAWLVEVRKVKRTLFPEPVEEVAA